MDNLRFLEVDESGLVIGGPYLCDDEDFVAEMGWVGPIDDLPLPHPEPGWTYDGKTFTPPKEEVSE